MNKFSNHFASLVDTSHIKITVILLVPSVFLIIGAQIIGLNENFPAVVMHFTGVVLLLLSLLHPWREIKNYAFLAAGSLGTIYLLHLSTIVISSLHFKKNISEENMMRIYFLFCLPGIFAGIVGIIYLLSRKR
jgi:hypothetical protein